MSVLRRNISLLFIIQLSNYVFPLLTIPYLSRVLGAENFGFLAISQAVIQYFIFFTEYGFNLSVTRKISLNRHDKSRVSEIFFSTMYA
ncbi:oligosaccharide flippase family protein, partial [Obesumbacterium proteus]